MKRDITVNEWIDILRNEVEQRFNKNMVNGFEDSATSIKLGILSEIYDEEPMNNNPKKERAFAKLADEYDLMSSWS